MATRQYIGARYVPKLMGEWDKNISYENLVIVTYKGNSFTSKQNVPQGVDISDKNYWVNTANFNAQLITINDEISSINDEISSINGEITTINGEITTINGEITTINGEVTSINNEITSIKDEINANLGIVIGDSYTTHDPNSGGVTYTKNLGELLVENGCLTNCFSYGVNGARYAINSNSNFMSQLESASSDDRFNNDDVKVIIIEGGQNERFESNTEYNRIYNDVKSTLDYAKSKFVNANIYVIPIGWNGVKSNTSSMDYIWNPIINCANDNGVNANRTSLFFGRGVNYTWGTDNTHPTYETLKIIANKIKAFINGYENIFHFPLAISGSEGVTILSSSLSNDGYAHIKIDIYSTTKSFTANSNLGYIYPQYATPPNNLYTFLGTNKDDGTATAGFYINVDSSNGAGNIRCFKEIPINARVQCDLSYPI